MVSVQGLQLNVAVYTPTAIQYWACHEDSSWCYDLNDRRQAGGAGPKRRELVSRQSSGFRAS